MKPEQVSINTLYAGGSFGRRANPVSDYIVEAVSVAKALGANGKPVKLIWTREDDIRGGHYRPMYFHSIEAGLDPDGTLTAWRQRIVGQSILQDTPFAAVMVKDGVDETSVEGAATMPYTIPNLQVELHTTQVGVPVLWWRSVGNTHTAYANEVFLDELAHAAGKDPVVFRREMLKDPRHLGVLNLAAEKAGWGKPLPTGKGRGVALHKSFGTYGRRSPRSASHPTAGQGRSRRVRRRLRVAINPDVIKAQMEGAIGFGIGAVLYGAITLKGGQVEQSNFFDYQVLRIEDMPAVEVYTCRRAKPQRCRRARCPAGRPGAEQRRLRGLRQAHPHAPFASGSDT